MLKFFVTILYEGPWKDDKESKMYVVLYNAAVEQKYYVEVKNLKFLEKWLS